MSIKHTERSTRELTAHIVYGQHHCAIYRSTTIRRDWRTLVVHLSGELPRDPNQSSAPPDIDYKRLTPDEAKEMHSMHL